LVVESFSDRPVIHERLEFRHAVGATVSARKKSVEIDRLLCVSPTFPDHACKGPASSLLAHLLEFLEKIEKLGERNFPSSSRRSDCRDVATIEPSFKRRLADAEESGRVGRTNCRTGKTLEKLERGHDLLPQLRRGVPSRAPKSQDARQEFWCLELVCRHASKSSMNLNYMAIILNFIS
jgi:hypothetical protein